MWPRSRSISAATWPWGLRATINGCAGIRSKPSPSATAKPAALRPSIGRPKFTSPPSRSRALSPTWWRRPRNQSARRIAPRPPPEDDAVMSFFPAKDPAFGDARSSDAIAQIIVPRSVDLGGFQVHRALPSARSRMVGPFIFFDHFGPAVFKAGDGMDVRPHPHIGLATVTYLFDGEIVHRDSLGSAMPIRPGSVNWMTAGRGIAHSERTAADRRDGGEPLHGLQLWVALPINDEERGPAFAHTAAADHPHLIEGDMTLRVVAGSLHGLRSPVTTSWETMFADVRLKAGATMPLDAEHEERAIYRISGEIEIGGARRPPQGA